MGNTSRGVNCHIKLCNMNPSEKISFPRTQNKPELPTLIVMHTLKIKLNEYAPLLPVSINEDMFLIVAWFMENMCYMGRNASVPNYK